jgi:predicted HicB family RNase H-like nuclease
VSAPAARSRRRPLVPAAEQKQLQIRLPPALRRRLAAECQRRMVSTNLLVERAIEQALDDWEQQQLP